MSAAPPAAESWTSLQRWAFWLTYAGYGSTYLIRKPLSLVKSAVVAETGLSIEAVGRVDSAFLVMYAVGQFVLQPLERRAQSGTLLAAGMALSALSCFAFVRADDGNEMAFWWGFSGFCQAALYGVSMRVLSGAFGSGSRGTVMGIWGSSQTFASFLSALLSSFLLSAATWQVAIALPAAVVLAVAAAVYWFMPATEHLRRSQSIRHIAEAAASAAATPARGSPSLHARRASGDASNHISAEGTPAANGRSAHTRRVSGDATSQDVAHPLPPAHPHSRARSGPEASVSVADALLHVPGTLALSLSYFFVKLLRYVLMMWLPYYLHVGMSLAPAEAGYLSSVLDVGSMLGSIVYGYVCDSWYPHHRSTVSAAGCLATLLSLLWFRWLVHGGAGVAAAGAALFVLGVVVAGPSSILAGAAAADLADESSRGRAAASAVTASVSGFGSTGAALQGFVVGGVTHHFGWDGLVVALAVLCGVSAAFLVPVMRLELGRGALSSRKAHKD